MSGMDYLDSVPTRGRTLDYAAGVYDLLEPWVMFGQQAKINAEVIDALNLGTDDRVLDVGCGTGVVTRAIADRLLKMGNGIVMGIDAAGKMIWGAREKGA